MLGFSSVPPWSTRVDQCRKQAPVPLVSQWALQRKKRKCISVGIWLRRKEPLDRAATATTVAFHRAKWKYTRVSLPTHTHSDTETQVIKVIGVNCLARFSFWIKSFPFWWKDNPLASCFSFNSRRVFSLVKSGVVHWAEDPICVTEALANLILFLRPCLPLLSKVQLMPLTFNNLQTSVKSSN